MNRRRPTRALASGFVALAAWRLASILTVWTVLPALLAASPLVPALRDAFSETLAGDHVLRNHPTFAATDAFDFLHDYRAVVAGTG